MAGHPFSTTSLTSWLSHMKTDDIDDGLAADFDGSLSGLGVELGSSTYNMSEALLALPVFKEEAPDEGFQYVLTAATSPATKLYEETLTYLNQGQPYEIKVKKVGASGALKGKKLRSVLRVMFHERRLQYNEKEQLEFWTRNRPGERIVDVDIPLSYGVREVSVPRHQLNVIELTWDPANDCGVYIKINAISTEFTPRKHGGEKGVPFRVQVETYSDERLVHGASCQVKVFKPKGADRKHKTDREKIEKRSESEKAKYQPSYDCTVLAEIPLDQIRSYLTQQEGQGAPGTHKTESSPGASHTTGDSHSSGANHSSALSLPGPSASLTATPATVTNHTTQASSLSSAPAQPLSSAPISSSQSRTKSSAVRSHHKVSSAGKKVVTQSSPGLKVSPGSSKSSQEVSQEVSPGSAEVAESQNVFCIKDLAEFLDTQTSPQTDAGSRAAVSTLIEPLSPRATAHEVTQWLHKHRFSHFVKVFQNFAGADLLRLSRDDLIQICGLADGIRLDNALQSRTVRPKLTIYVNQSRRFPGGCVGGGRGSRPTPMPSEEAAKSSVASTVNLLEALNTGEVTRENCAAPVTPPGHSCTAGSHSTDSSTVGNQDQDSAVEEAVQSPSAVPTTPHTPPAQHPAVLDPASPPSVQTADSQPTLASPTNHGDTHSAITTGNHGDTRRAAVTGGHQGWKRQFREEPDADEDEMFYTKKQRTRQLELATKGVYHAVYLEFLTVAHLRDKLAELFSVTGAQVLEVHVQGPSGILVLVTDDVLEVYVQGPSGILVLVTDDVVQNLPHQARYNIEAYEDEVLLGFYKVLLQSNTQHGLSP